jgi:hypothetical protein
MNSTCWCISKLSSPNDAFLTTPGAVGVVVTALRNNHVKASSALNAVDAVCTMCTVPGVSLRIGAMNGCESVTQILVKFFSDADVLESCFMAVAELCRNCNQNKEAFYRVGIFNQIVKVLSKNGNTQILIAAVLRACFELSRGHRKNQEEISNINSLKTLYRAASSSFIASDVIASLACGFVGNLATMGTSFQMRLLSANFVNLVVDCVRAHGNSLNTCREGLWAICCLSYRCNENKVKLGSIGACETIMSTFKQYGQIIPLIALWSCGACANLTANYTENCMRFGSLDACEEIFTTLALYSNNILNNLGRPKDSSSPNKDNDIVDGSKTGITSFEVYKCYDFFRL